MLTAALTRPPSASAWTISTRSPRCAPSSAPPPRRIIGRLSLLFSQLGQAVARTGQALDEAGGGASGGRPGDAPPGGRLRAVLDARRACGRSAPDTRPHGPAVQGRHRPAAYGLPGPAPRRARRRAPPALREPITGIGRAVGWPDQSIFARRFKRTTGSARPHTASASRPGRPISKTPLAREPAPGSPGQRCYRLAFDESDDFTGRGTGCSGTVRPMTWSSLRRAGRARLEGSLMPIVAAASWLQVELEPVGEGPSPAAGELRVKSFGRCQRGR